MWGLLWGVAKGVICTGNDGIQTITRRCTPTGGLIDIRFIQFRDCVWRGNGAAIYIHGGSLVSIGSCSFLNCIAGSPPGTNTDYDSDQGGCAYLRRVNSGSSVIDSCATKCGAFAGSFVCLESRDVDVALKGLSLFDLWSAFGALRDHGVRAVASRSNLTGLKGGSGLTGTMYQEGRGVSMDGSFILFANCSGGWGCFVRYDGSAVFRQCLFVGNSVGAIAHCTSLTTSQTRLESCYFINTKLRGDWFMAGSVLVDRCLFAGEVQSTVSFISTGVQISFTSTEMSFDTASLLPLCDKYGKFETPKRTGTPATWMAISCVVLHLALLVLGFTL
jgi:hypothetical protein